jgi:UDP-N-acetylglucosamine acyltransferase
MLNPESAGIHPTAVIHPRAELDSGVAVGPFAVIGEGVTVGAGTVIGAHVVLEGPTAIGRDNRIGPFACLGGAPQHVSYRGEPTRLRVGDRNLIREYVTLHRGTVSGRGETVVGNDNFIMIGCHVAHDCVLGNHVLMANQALLAGHVILEDHAVLGGLSGVHQYCRVGRGAMLAAISGAPMDVPPWSLVAGDRARFIGLNRVGIKRVGLSPETAHALRRAYRTIFRSHLKLEEALVEAQEEFGADPEVAHLLEFIRTSQRGVIR